MSELRPLLDDHTSAPAGGLASLRRNDVPLPEARFLDTSPIELLLISPETVEAWLAALGLLVDRAALIGRLVAVDLDDTLLHSSYTRPELVREPPRDSGRSVFACYRYSEMRHSLWRTLRFGLRATAYERVDRRRHPALGAPRVLIRPNIALISCLVWLKQQGVTLVLTTATSLLRVDYLRARLPIIDVLFGPRIVAAEHLGERAEAAAKRLVQPALMPCKIWQISAELHRRRPLSIMAKSPWAVATALGMPAYDLLVDDSATTAELLRESGLNARLLWIAPDDLQPAYAVSVLAAIVDRLTGAPPPSQTQPLAGSSLIADLALPEPEAVLIEDPWYYPLLHVRDQIELAEHAADATRTSLHG